MQAVILAGGQGNRLLPYTKDRPKCMLDLNGITLYEKQLQTYKACHIDDVIVVRHEGFPWSKIPTDGVVHCIDTDRFNMVHSFSRTFTKLTTDTVVSYGDIVFDKATLQKLIKSTYDISVVVDLEWKSYYELRFGDPYLDAESLRMEGDKIIDIGRPNPNPKDIEAQYTGLVKFSEAGLAQWKAIYHQLYEEFAAKPWRHASDFRSAFMTDMLQECIDVGYPVHAVPIEHGWLEFDTARDYEMQLEWFKSEAGTKYLSDI